MSSGETYKVFEDSLEISGLDTILKFCRFHPLSTNVFMAGVQLSDDLRSDSGTILYPKETEITWEHMNRLLRLRESNPNIEFLFKIKRSEKLLQSFREEIQGRMQDLLNRRQGNRIFKDFTSAASKCFDSVVKKILSENEIILELYRLRFFCDLAKSKRASTYFDHAINAAIISLSIVTAQKADPALARDEEKLCLFVKTGLFCNYGAIYNADKILEMPPEERPKMYWNTVRQGLEKLKPLNLGQPVMAALQNLCDYQDGKRDFVLKEKWTAPTNVLLVADYFLQKEGGLFSDPQDVRQVVDRMNVKTQEKQFSEQTVQALTLGLTLTDIFDFYSELDRLKKKCPYDSAVPYPLTGLNSPTIYVCKKGVTKCPFLETSVKAVHLVTRLGELSPGDYQRCKLLTPKLLVFYDEHYVEIKDSTTDKGKPAPKTGAATPVPIKVAGAVNSDPKTAKAEPPAPAKPEPEKKAAKT